MKNKFKFLATMLIGILLSVNVWGEETWTKVSSVSEITSGGTFIIGYWDGDTDFPSYLMPMQNTGTASTSAAGYMYSGITEGECDDKHWLDMDDPGETAIYEVEISASSVVSGAVNIKCGSNYIGNENAKNCCKLYASTSATTAFTPTITDGYVTLKIDGNTSYHSLQYNTSSPRFAVYNGGQKNLVLYKKASTSTPAITITASLTDFTYEAGAGPSAAQSFTVGGSNLTADITVTAPTNFEVSKSSESGYASSVSLTPATGTVSNTTIYVRMKSGLSQGTGKGGNITLSSTGATSQTIAVVGTVSAPAVKHNVRWHVGTDVTTDEVAEGAAIAFPADPLAPAGCEGKSFYGWAKSAIDGEAEDAPTVYTSETMGTEDIDFYAVFADKEGEGENGWVKITAAEDIIAGVYAVISYDEAYYLPTASSSSNPTATAVTKTDDKIDILDAMKWNLTISEGVINLESATTAGVYAWGGSANDGVRVNSTSAKANATKDWRVKTTTNYGLVLYNNATTDDRYLSTFGTTDWRNYTSTSSTNRAANLYKLENNTTYSAFVTSCKACESEVAVTKANCENGTFTVSKETVCADDAGGSVTVTCTPNEHYHVSAVTATVGTMTGSGNSYTVSGITAATEITVTFAIDQQITVTWNVNGTATPQILWPGEHVTALPEAPTVMPTCANTFMGWSTETLIGEGNDAPKDLFNKIEDLPEITADITFNAVFAKAEGSGEELWTKVTDLTQVGEGEYAILVDAENPYAFSGSVNSSGHGESTSQIFNFDSNGQATSAPEGTCVLTIAAVENGYTMYCAGKGYLYAKAASSGNLAWSNSAPSRYWNTHTKNDVTNWSYYGTTNSEPWYAHIRMFSTTLRTYGSNSGNAVIFVKKGTGTTYSNYVTTCATYTVTWMSNGFEIRKDENVAPGTELTAPTLAEIKAKAAACNDHLVGWMPAASTNNPKVKQDSAPTGMVGQQVTVTGNVVYHAVYADVAGE